MSQRAMGADLYQVYCWSICGGMARLVLGKMAHGGVIATDLEVISDLNGEALCKQMQMLLRSSRRRRRRNSAGV